MNLKEGTRRLALLLGAVGAILGGFIAYFQFQDTVRHRAEYLRWTQLANSDTVRQAILAAKASDAQATGDQNTVPIPEGAQVGVPGVAATAPWATECQNLICWNRDYAVVSIVTKDGLTHYPVQAPGVWSYAAVVALPLLGFFIPWGAVRASGWVGAGFVASPK
jgi:hypothetical protein